MKIVRDLSAVMFAVLVAAFFLWFTGCGQVANEATTTTASSTTTTTSGGSTDTTTTTSTTTTTTTTSTTSTTLGAPSISSVAATSNSRELRVSWSSLSGAASYRLYRATAEAFTPAAGNLISSEAASPYNDSNLVAGTTYYYKLIALDSNGNATSASSAQSAAAAFMWAAAANIDAGAIISDLAFRCLDMAKDSSGNLHLVYVSGEAPAYGLYYRRYASGTWGNAVTIDSDISDNTTIGSVSIAVETGGTAHIVYFAYTGTLLKHVYSSNYTAWTSENVGSLAVNNGKYSDVAADSGGNIHVAYSLAVDSSLQYIRKISGGSWDTAHQAGSTAINGIYLNLAIDADNKPYVATFNGGTSDLKLAYAASSAPTAAGNWSTAQVDPTGTGMSHVGFDISANNNLHFSYKDLTTSDNEFNYSLMTSPTATPAETDIVSSSTGWYTALALDSNGKAHIIYTSDNNGSGGNLQYTNNTSGSFLTGTSIITLESTVTVKNCAAAIANNYLHVVYVDDTSDDLKFIREAYGN